jgi:aminotransferase
MERLVNSRTKAIIVNTPTNPSGKVFSKSELKQLCEFAKRHDLYIITDEIYEYFLYDGSVHISPGSFREYASRIITISGYSKTFSITGWRIGYLVCPADLRQTIGFVHDLMYVCAPAPLQSGVVAGIKRLKPDFYSELSQSYQRKRDVLCGALDDAGLDPIVPRGAYYVLADISAIRGGTSKQKAMRLLRQTGIAAVPGQAFYHDTGGEDLARFCFAKRDKVLLKAARKLRKQTF